MNLIDAHQKSVRYLKILCEEIPDRSVGSEGNRRATAFFEEMVSRFGWEIEITPLNALDWEENGASLLVGEQPFEVWVSPYSLGCSVEAPLMHAGTLEALSHLECRGSVLLLHGELTQEALMPKNFTFYNTEEHQRIISLIEQKQPAALICATSKNVALAGGMYPFPLIEDGDFDIPSVYTTEDIGLALLHYVGQSVRLESRSRRIPSHAFQVVARKGNDPDRRIVVSAHIDAKKGSAGAIDNATGVVVLLLLAEMFSHYSGAMTLELAPFNGEDYYAMPGQMNFLQQNQGRFHTIWLNINIDGTGYQDGDTAFSLFNVSEEIKRLVEETFSRYEGLVEGNPWYQGDHSLFVQQGCPAMALTSQWFLEHGENQGITHTSKDRPYLVDHRKLVVIAEALCQLLDRLTRLT